jgi:hypothetical protein
VIEEVRDMQDLQNLADDKKKGIETGILQVNTYMHDIF